MSGFAFRMADIAVDVAACSGDTVEKIRGRDMSGLSVQMRQAFVWIARTAHQISYPKLGKYLDGRDHSVILHAFRRAEERRERDRSFATFTDELTARAIAREEARAAAPEAEAA